MNKTVTKHGNNTFTGHCRTCGQLCRIGQGYMVREASKDPKRPSMWPGWSIKCAKCLVAKKPTR